MPDSIRRVQAFNEKVGPGAAWGRVGSKLVVHRYGVSAGKSFRLEHGVKGALAAYPGAVPRVSGPAYLAFARKAGRTLGQYGAGTIAVELLALEDLVAARGLSRTIWRFVLLRVFGYGSPVPPFVVAGDSMNIIPASVNVGPNLVRYVSLAGSSATEAASRFPVARPGNLASLAMNIVSNTLNGAVVFTVRIGGVPTALVVSVGAGLTGLFWVTGTVPVVAGSAVSVEADSQGAAVGLMKLILGVEHVPT